MAVARRCPSHPEQRRLRSSAPSMSTLLMVAQPAALVQRSDAHGLAVLTGSGARRLVRSHAFPRPPRTAPPHRLRLGAEAAAGAAPGDAPKARWPAATGRASALRDSRHREDQARTRG